MHVCRHADCSSYDDEQRAGYRAAQNHLRGLLTQSGKGSLLRGWRCELDPDGLCELSFYDLCAAAARIGFHEDIVLLYQDDDDLRSFKLSTLVPDLAKLFDRFRKWVKQEFSSPAGFFKYLDSTSHSGTVTVEEFGNALQRKNFVTTPHEQAELFGMCDCYGTGIVTCDDLVVLETNVHIRDQELFKIRTKSQQQRQRFLASVYLSDCERDVRPTHRQAPRAWHSTEFEKLPTVEAQRHEEWQLEKQRREANAFSHFTQELRERYGCELRAWRRGLDPGAKFALKPSELRRYCRKMNSKVDVNNLQRHIESNCEGTLLLEELCPLPAACLARFRHWAIETCGSVVGLWDREEVMCARMTHTRNGSWASDKKMLRGALGSVLRDMGWGEFTDVDSRNNVLQALDLHGCGFVSREDFEWLEKWIPPEWVWAVPNMDSCNQLKSLLLEKYGHPLAAWRQVLDVDDSNTISWAEFKSACTTVGFKGDIAGAWRAMDVDVSGSISMWEYDVESADLLTSFKAWVDQNFGSVRLAFKAIDRDGSNSVSLPELRRLCNELRWDGDVHEIFKCLDKGTNRDSNGNAIGKRQLTIGDLLFLDRWKVEIATKEELELVIANEDVGEETAFDPSTRHSRRGDGSRRLSGATLLALAVDNRASEITASAPDRRVSSGAARQQRSASTPETHAWTSLRRSATAESTAPGWRGTLGISTSEPPSTSKGGRASTTGRALQRRAVRRGSAGMQSAPDLLATFRMPPLQGWSAGRKSDSGAPSSGSTKDPLTQPRQRRAFASGSAVTTLPSPPGTPAIGAVRCASRGVARGASRGTSRGAASISYAVSFQDAPNVVKFDDDDCDDMPPSRLPSRGSSRLEAIAW